ncbi:MAG TPA: type II toxin-antitoxin system VapC family toxin [Anaerolineae bacterium]|nr:type II toxin-antitoxin system VapC family toxin [Anaerolineae bacterium]HQK14168.1 type II toxin-antitoxin system VapC family toxin [Anaerolineae bacterium]
MGTLSELTVRLQSAKRIALDTVVFIYAFERHPHYGARAQAVFRLLETGVCQGVVSVLALGEILTGVKKADNPELLLRYRDVLTRFPGLSLLDADVAVMEAMSDLRVRYALPTPDAIHLATAIVGGAHAFVTNDARLQQVKELEIILLADWE